MAHHRRAQRLRAPHVGTPSKTPNMFILYRRSVLNDPRFQHIKSQTARSVLIGIEWGKLTKAEKKPFAVEAAKLKRMALKASDTGPESDSTVAPGPAAPVGHYRTAASQSSGLDEIIKLL
ncbi:hypothetical protein C8R46DRAFT_1342971, partial [Mycena filopes]